MANIFIVLDGLQDIAYPELEGKTPYAWGKGTYFRMAEAASLRGRFATTPAGFEPDTQTCILTLLGVAPGDIPLGRSYIESQAIGLAVGRHDMVLRCNFVKVTPDGILADPTCAAPPDVARQLKEAVAAIPGHSITQVGPYKSLQVVKDGGAFLQGMVTYAPHNHGGKPLESLLPSGNELARRLAAFSREQLKRHAPFTVLNWAQAIPGKLPSFASLHNGMSGAMISATHAPMGCAAAMGMACPSIPAATGDTDTDLGAKAAAALAWASQTDVVMVHIGGPDEATHRRDPREKAEFVKKLDAQLLAPIIMGMAAGTRVLLTCDHRALCATGGHTDEPVDFWLYEKGKERRGDRGVLDGRGAVGLLTEEMP